MHSQLRPAIVLFVILTIITGVAYPLVITGIAQLLFAEKANGSLIKTNTGQIVGSTLIGQEFSGGTPAEAAHWFWGRMSATGPVPYTALNIATLTGSSGSNLAQSNPVLVENIKARVAALAAAESAVGVKRTEAIPFDLLTSSGSGLDPHISPEAAEYQVARVSRARGVSEESIRGLIKAHTTPRTVGVLGEPVVNVLELNLALAGVSVQR